MKSKKIDFHQNLDKWMTIKGTGLQVMAKAGEPLGVFYFRKKGEKHGDLPKLLDDMVGTEDVPLPSVPQDVHDTTELRPSPLQRQMPRPKDYQVAEDGH